MTLLMIVMIAVGAVVFCWLKDYHDRHRPDYIISYDANLKLCQEHLNTFHSALEAFVKQHGERLPVELRQLRVEGYVASQWTFYCPETGDNATDQDSYELARPGSILSELPASDVIVREKGFNHSTKDEGKFRFVLHVDGSIGRERSIPAPTSQARKLGT